MILKFNTFNWCSRSCPESHIEVFTVIFGPTLLFWSDNYHTNLVLAQPDPLNPDKTENRNMFL